MDRDELRRYQKALLDAKVEGDAAAQEAARAVLAEMTAASRPGLMAKITAVKETARGAARNDNA